MHHVEQWVIYDHPRDHPDHVVVRRWLIGSGRLEPNEAYLCADLDAARQVVADNYPGSAYWMPRSPEDDPSIIEVWI